eukprot:TRINITY_DN5356_c0_g4_i1.p1 TRINITY_DN5356_c0_g4~~TRINITY_DN5356_c0_g4_i1.p1  ORF type:complete len:150 (+),score=48.52 TRINITY_DN5356_c0_g4_i1:728-1177(+)
MKFNRIEALEAQIIESDKTINELKNEKDLLIESNEVAQRELELLQTSFNNLKEEVQDKEKAVKELEEVKEELKSLKSELSLYKDSLEVERRKFFSSIKNKDPMMERSAQRMLYSNVKDSASKIHFKDNANKDTSIKSNNENEFFNNYLI